jgi:hypothetical protein
VVAYHDILQGVVVNEVTITNQQATEAIQALTVNGVAGAEVVMLSHEQASCPVNHYFGPGIYIREVSIAAGVFAIGHRQTQEHVNIMLKGSVLMMNEDGTTYQLNAPLLFTGKPGRKMGYILEDVVWQNVYATTERDVQVLESMFLDKSPAWVDANEMRMKSEYVLHEADRADFADVLFRAGFSAETVQRQSENTSDQRPMPGGAQRFKLGQSPIHGTGVFATANITANEVIGPARIEGLRTPLGRYTNHSKTPNAYMRLHGSGDISLVALKDISGCNGGRDGDEVTIDYRQALRLSGITCTTIGELT